MLISKVLILSSLAYKQQSLHSSYIIEIVSTHKHHTIKTRFFNILWCWKYFRIFLELKNIKQPSCNIILWYLCVSVSFRKSSLLLSTNSLVVTHYGLYFGFRSLGLKLRRCMQRKDQIEFPHVCWCYATYEETKFIVS